MKKAILIFVSICTLAMNAVAADVVEVVGAEAQTVMESLKYPKNLSAEMLKAAIGNAKAMDLAIDRLVVQKLGEDRYQVSFLLNNETTAEVVQISISEVQVTNGKSYVFGFQIERIVKMNKYPGVTLGNN